jgi:hypothetical protein
VIRTAEVAEIGKVQSLGEIPRDRGRVMHAQLRTVNRNVTGSAWLHEEAHGIIVSIVGTNGLTARRERNERTREA